MHDIPAEQSRQNRTTERQWQMYATHRRQIETLIVPDHPGSTLCVLGAGNCNDLDLKWLETVYRQIHLTDLDTDAVQQAISRQGVSSSSKFHIHAPIDLTKSATPWGKCDVVLSPCVLTQIIIPSRKQPDARSLRDSLRARHLELIRDSLVPGGRSALVIDLVSSEKIPDLARIPPDATRAAMDRFIKAEKHFRGLDPRSLNAAAQKAGLMATFAPPWIWHLGLRKSFLVYALTLRSSRPAF